METLITEYDRLFGDRDRFLWQWVYSLLPSVTLSTVPGRHQDEVRTQKMVLTMYATVLDDLIEHHGDRRTFREARRLPTEQPAVDPDRSDVDTEQFAFIERLWETFETGIEDAPRYEEFHEILEYDIRQTTNAMDYSALLNANPCLANLRGTRRYGAHNMTMFPYADVDLMYSPTFAVADLGAVRTLLWDLQELARIGNWLTTWEREIEEGDFSAGVVVRALEADLVTPGQLRRSENDALETIRDHDIEQQFRDRWRRRYRELQSREVDTESVDLAALVEGIETVFEYHLASRGHK